MARKFEGLNFALKIYTFYGSIFEVNLKFITFFFALTASMDDTENFDEFKHLWVEPNVVGFTDKFQV